MTILKIEKEVEEMIKNEARRRLRKRRRFIIMRWFIFSASTGIFFLFLYLFVLVVHAPIMDAWMLSMGAMALAFAAVMIAMGQFLLIFVEREEMKAAKRWDVVASSNLVMELYKSKVNLGIINRYVNLLLRFNPSLGQDFVNFVDHLMAVLKEGNSEVKT